MSEGNSGHVNNNADIPVRRLSGDSMVSARGQTGGNNAEVGKRRGRARGVRRMDTIVPRGSPGTQAAHRGDPTTRP
eukprot:1180303-Prorocentrum_minimum.AAC.1